MPRDSQGLPLTGDAASAEAFDRAVAEYYGLTGDPVGILKAASDKDPAFALGGVAMAGLFMIGGFRPDHPEVAGALEAARAAIRGTSPREQKHLAAVEAWAAGKMFEATRIWEAILSDHPTDALALRFVHDAYFFLGQSLAIRDSLARVLPAWETQNPLTSFVQGQYAFGLEEAGELRRAEEVAREAIASNSADAWAVHALAHVLEMDCRQEEGIAFLKSSRPNWRNAHFMAGHNGWHLALYLIEEGRFEEVVADYDRFVTPKLADDAPLDRVDDRVDLDRRRRHAGLRLEVDADRRRVRRVALGIRRCEQVDRLRREQERQRQQHDLRRQQQGEDAVAEQFRRRLAALGADARIGRNERGIEGAFGENGAKMVWQPEGNEKRVGDGTGAEDCRQHDVAGEPGQPR